MSGSANPADETSAWEELRRLAPLCRRHGWAAPVVVALGLAAALAESIGVSLVVLFLYVLLGQAAEAAGSGGPLGRIFVAAESLVGGSSFALAAAILALLLGKALLGMAYGLVIATVRQGISEDMRDLVHAQYLDVTYGEISRRDYGALLDTLAAESWRVADAWHAAARMAINLCAILVFGSMLLVLSWQLALVAAAGSSLLALALRLLSRRGVQLGTVALQANRHLAARMLATLQGMRTIRAFGLEEEEKARFRDASAATRRSFLQLERLHVLIGPLGEVGSLMVLAAIVLAALLLGVPTAAVLVAVALLHRLNPHLRELDGQRAWLAGATAALRAVREMTERAGKSYPRQGELPFPGLREAIRFVGVSFTHAGEARPALRTASFAVPQGAMTTIIGPSGAGKTTIVNLLLRLYEPDDGVILVNGEPLQRLRRGAWLGRIALAGQDTELFPGTLAENIRMGRPGADLAELRAAAAEAGILGFTESLPDGFGTGVGERGLRLSGGQRQRIGLARALLRNPELLILDEATSAVDRALDDEIRARLLARRPRMTILVITHRLAAAAASDHVIWLSEGEVEEQGPPQLVMRRSGGTGKLGVETPTAFSPSPAPP